jgi:hypothetical protein
MISAISEINSEIFVCREEEKIFTGRSTNEKIRKLEERRNALEEKYAPSSLLSILP